MSAALQTPDVEAALSAGHDYSRRGAFGQAEACARKVIELRPDHAMAHNNLGAARQAQGDVAGALAAYEKALALAPGMRLARRNLAALLARLGREDECLPYFHAELRDEQGLRWLQDRVQHGLKRHDIVHAAQLNAVSAALRLGTSHYPPGLAERLRPFPVQAPPRRLTIPKLRHDIQQFDYLLRQGVFLPAVLEPVIERYERVIARLERLDTREPVELAGENLAEIGDVYNRLMYVRPAPRVGRALSSGWDPAEVENQYLDTLPGIVVVDDFFSPEALHALRQFCLESTFWSGNRYAHGRLGAFFHDGFNAPLLVQIAEELRAAMPRVIGDKHPLSQMWGFKNAPRQPGASTTHADFAAVNVNVWITPDDANLDPSTGGLKIYDIDAPKHWDFPTYNGRSDVIGRFLDRQHARAVTIPYRQNRAVIFNSDLFHGTDTVHFRSEYENRRINVTMLYGVREDDHRHIAPAEVPPEPHEATWRSAAFTRVRGRR